jgi:hypothetical protein
LNPEVKIVRNSNGGNIFFTISPIYYVVHILKLNFFYSDKTEAVTYLEAGQYFGQRYFVTNRLLPRNATVIANTHLEIACISPGLPSFPIFL